jgi:hypothetical protein
MNIYVVNQNPESKYNDEEGSRYDYPTSIPNGKQIKIGDILIFNLSSKASKSLRLGNKRIVGIGKIDTITLYYSKNKEMAIASYEWYKKFEPPFSFEDIGGDPRINIQHSMNKVSEDKVVDILLQLIRKNK